MKSALVVVGGSLAATQATALELGEVKVHSALGQPLRASIAYALAPNEMISDTCVSLQPAGGASGLPAIERGSLIVTDGVIAITGSSIVREPMVSMRVAIRCQYTPQLVRDYMLFIDPPGVVPVVDQPPERVAVAPQLEARPAQPSRRPAAVNREPIVNASRYQVQPGDSVSMIAQRIQDRPVGLWDAVNQIVAANPDAFIDNDPNRLKAGTWLTIPSFGASAPLTLAEATSGEPAVADPIVPTEQSTVYEPAEPGVATPVEEATEQPAGESPSAGLQPGDLIVNNDNPYVEPAVPTSDETVSIPDTAIEGQEITAASPNAPTTIIRQPAAAQSTPSSTNWLLWLGGGGVAIILALLLFGRRLRDRFGSSPIAPTVPQRRATDGDTDNVETIGDVDMEIVDDLSTAENVMVDADLIAGTGLREGTDVDVAQDFAFASTTALDLELPEEATIEEIPETDIIPPIRTDEHAILESEILPDDDEYDMSVIVDATKMPHPDEVTERDLEAIQVNDDDEILITGDYTVSQEVDYKILEQDYEDEMTATQALNAEIQKAAEEIANNLDATSEMPLAGADETSETSATPILDTDATEALPLATVYELGVTSQMPAKEKEIGDDDDTGVNPTVNMEGEDETVKMAEDNTVEMPKGKAG
ncbi:MAG: hypothetical protein P8X81_04420 [Woeseiaceae bacterium]